MTPRPMLGSFARWVTAVAALAGAACGDALGTTASLDAASDTSTEDGSTDQGTAAPSPGYTLIDGTRRQSAVDVHVPGCVVQLMLPHAHAADAPSHTPLEQSES